MRNVINHSPFYSNLIRNIFNLSIQTSSSEKIVKTQLKSSHLDNLQNKFFQQNLKSNALQSKILYKLSITKMSSKNRIQKVVDKKVRQEQLQKDVVELKHEEEWQWFINEVSKGKPLILLFYAVWCKRSKDLIPSVSKEVERMEGKLKLLIVNIDKFAMINLKMEIKSLPTLLLMYNQTIFDKFPLEVSKYNVEELIYFYQSAERIIQNYGVEIHIKNMFKKAAIEIGQARYYEAESILKQFNSQQIKQEFSCLKQLYMLYIYSKTKRAVEFQNQIKEIGLDKFKQQSESYYNSSELHSKIYSSILTTFTEGFQNKVQSDFNLSQNIQNSTLSTIISDIKDQIEDNPTNFELRFKLMMVYKENGFLEEFMKEGVEIIKRDKNWENRKINKIILEMFKELGPSHQITVKYRKIMQRILY